MVVNYAAFWIGERYENVVEALEHGSKLADVN